MEKTKYSVKWMTVCAMLMAVNVVLSSRPLSIPVPGGAMYLNDAVITLAACLLDPLGAFVVGGLGALLGDLLFYPAPAVTSLLTHGVQAVVIALLVGMAAKTEKQKLPVAIGAAALGVVINVVGYTLGRTFLYSTWEYAVMKLPFQCLQAAVGSALGVVLAFPLGLRKAYRKIVQRS